MDGRVVRLTHGKFDAVTDYGGDPVIVAERYRDVGAEWIHVVDLSGARDGAMRQTDMIAGIAKTGLNIQTGGGVRRRADIGTLLEAGARRVIIGSLAVTDPVQVMDWISVFGRAAICAAFDIRMVEGDAFPAIKGWTETGSVSLNDLLAVYAQSGLEHALVTDIGRDGALEGPAVDLYRNLTTDWPDIQWQASGGVASLADVTDLTTTGVAGAIIGKALFENRFTLAEALSCSRGG
tara:strand:+ start:1583 stop:2290 length:708 start_codon:yes stop_codon:yes gene_type:complete